MGGHVYGITGERLCWESERESERMGRGKGRLMLGRRTKEVGEGVEEREVEKKEGGEVRK